MRKIVLAFFLAFVFSVSGGLNEAYARVITVSTMTGLKNAVNAAQSGDVINLTDGVYRLDDENGIVISNKDHITIKSKSGKRDNVIIQGNGINNPYTGFCFKIYNCDYFTLRGLTLKDVYWHHIQINEGSSYFTLKNLVMLDAGEAPVKVTSAGGNGPFSDFGLIENCWIGFSDYGERDVVEGIDIIASAGTVIRRNKFYKVRKRDYPWDAGWAVFAKCNAQDTIIDGNYFEDCDIPMSFGNGGCPPDYARYGDVTYQHRGGIIRNNAVNRTTDTAIYLSDAIDFKVYNNTLWSTFDGGWSSIDVRFNSSGEIINNICSEGYNLRDGGTAVFSNNIWWAAPSMFVNQAAGNLHLSYSATNAIDRGYDTLADVPVDYDLQQRPIGPYIDIGADEYKY